MRGSLFSLCCAVALVACGGQATTTPSSSLGGDNAPADPNTDDPNPDGTPSDNNTTGAGPCAEGFVLEGDLIDGDGTCVPVTHAPEAADDLFFLMETATDVPVLDNDVDADGDALEIVSFTQPSTGTVTQDTLGVLRFTPEGEDWQEVSFTYTVSDGNDESTANVTIQIGATCKEIITQQPASVDGSYVLDPPAGPGSLTQLFPAYCLMSYDGGGWTAVGLIERRSDVGYDDVFWHYAKWTESTVTHRINVLDGEHYGVDARGEGWSRIPGDEFLLDSILWGNWTNKQRYQFEFGSFASIREYFEDDSEQLMEEKNSQTIVSVNHNNARIYWNSISFYGGVMANSGKARDIDGNPDAFMFVR